MNSYTQQTHFYILFNIYSTFKIKILFFIWNSDKGVWILQKNRNNSMYMCVCVCVCVCVCMYVCVLKELAYLIILAGNFKTCRLKNQEETDM